MLRFLIGNISITIGMDSSKIESFIGQSGKFNQHMSIDGSTSWNGIPISEALLTWWDEGTRNSFVNLKPTNYWTDVFGDSGRKDNPNYCCYKGSWQMVFVLNVRKTQKLIK